MPQTSLLSIMLPPPPTPVYRRRRSQKAPSLYSFPLPSSPPPHLACRCCSWTDRLSTCSCSSSFVLTSLRWLVVLLSTSSSTVPSSRFSSSTRPLSRRTSASNCSARRIAWESSVVFSWRTFFSLLCACFSSDSSRLFSNTCPGGGWG